MDQKEQKQGGRISKKVEKDQEQGQKNAERTGTDSRSVKGTEGAEAGSESFKGAEEIGAWPRSEKGSEGTGAGSI